MTKDPATHAAAAPDRRKRTPKRPAPSKLGSQALTWRTFDPAGVGGGDLFGVELATYKDRLAELLKYEGQYVLIRGAEVIEFFSTLEAALEATEERFGTEPTLIKRVVRSEPIRSAGGLIL